MQKNQTINLAAKPVKYEANAYFAKASKFAFSFIKAQHKADKTAQKREEIEQQHDTKSSFWRIASFIAIGIAFGLGFFEAYNIQTSLAGIFNSGDSEQISPFLLVLLGLTFASIGLLLGHSMNVETDHITGRKKRTVKWWCSVVLSVLYVYGQFHLANLAGGSGQDGSTQQMSFFVLAIAICELFIGYLFLEKAIPYLFSFRLKLLQNWQHWKMSFAAKRTDQNWDYYVSYLQDFNFNNPYNLLEKKEETENIKAARSFYKDTSGYAFS